MAAYCTASFVPLIRQMCDTYVATMEDEKLIAWKESKLDGQNIKEEDM